MAVVFAVGGAGGGGDDDGGDVTRPVANRSNPALE